MRHWRISPPHHSNWMPQPGLAADDIDETGLAARSLSLD